MFIAKTLSFRVKIMKLQFVEISLSTCMPPLAMSDFIVQSGGL